MELAWKRLSGGSGHEAGRQLLAQMYLKKTGQPLPEILLTPQGKPYFREKPWHFSISHTDEMVFCCLSEKNVGIDAESLQRQIPMPLAEKILSPSEKSRLEAAPCQRDALLRLWVLKESYAKLTGKGLGNYLWNTDFDPQDPRIQIIDGCLVAVLSE